MTRCHIEYEVSSFWMTGDRVRTFEQKIWEDHFLALKKKNTFWL